MADPVFRSAYDFLAPSPDATYGTGPFGFFASNREGSPAWVQEGSNPRLSIPDWLRSAAQGVVGLGESTQTGKLTPEALALLTSGSVGTGALMAPRGALAAGAAKPRLFYRGTNPGDERRISTGRPSWDEHFFVSTDPDAARMYGKTITEYAAHPEARVLVEGTAEWRKIAGAWRKNESMLDYADRAAAAAKAAGYDAAQFKRQGDIGTAIFNRDKLWETEYGIAAPMPVPGFSVAPPPPQQAPPPGFRVANDMVF